MSIKHRFTSAKTDGGDATLVKPSNWNDSHDFPIGSVIFVDAVNGNDGTGARGNFSFPFLTIGAALTATGIASGDVIWVFPGTYTLASGATLPTGVTIRGFFRNSVTIQMTGVGGATTLITMGVSSALEDLALNLTTTGNFAVTGVLFPSTTSATARLRRCSVSVSNNGAGAVAAAVTGVLVQSTGAPDRSIEALDGCLVTVTADAAATGTIRGVLMNTSGGNWVANDTNVIVTGGANSRVAVEMNIAGGRLTWLSGNLNGPSFDALQTAGTLEFGYVVLVNNTISGTITYIGGSTKTVLLFYATGYFRTATGIDIQEAGKAFTIAAIVMRREKAGTGSSTIADILKNGTSIWNINPGNRPTITAASGDAQRVSAVPDTTSIAATDRLEMVLSQVETGNPQDAVVEIVSQ